MLSLSLGNLNVSARLGANVVGANMTAKTAVAEWQNGRVEEWQSGRGDLRRRNLQG